MKKTLCVIIAVIIALSSMSIVSVAAKKVPDFSMNTNISTAKVGDTVKVEIKVGKSSRLCALTMDLVYDNTYFSVVSATEGTKMDGVINKDYSAKRVRFTSAKAEELVVDAVLFTAEFKVLKTGGTFTLDAVEVCTTEKEGSSNWNDVTKDVQDKLENYSVTIACSHAVKETVVSQEATCSKEGSKHEKCKECSWKSEAVAIPKTAHDTEVVVIKKATCEETGSKVEKCKKCDYKGMETEIPANGHTEGPWITVEKATKTEKGLEQKKCLVCGKVLDEKEIPMLPLYKLGDVNDDGYITAVDARVILRAVAGLVELTDAQKLAADVTDDGEIGATDARMILQYVVGKVKF